MEEEDIGSSSIVEIICKFVCFADTLLVLSVSQKNCKVFLFFQVFLRRSRRESACLDDIKNVKNPVFFLVPTKLDKLNLIIHTWFLKFYHAYSSSVFQLCRIIIFFYPLKILYNFTLEFVFIQMVVTGYFFINFTLFEKFITKIKVRILLLLFLPFE